jgi:hypothetical protein
MERAACSGKAIARRGSLFTQRHGTFACPIDNEIDQLEAVEKSLPEVVPLALGLDQGHRVPSAGCAKSRQKRRRVLFEQDDLYRDQSVGFPSRRPPAAALDEPVTVDFGASLVARTWSTASVVLIRRVTARPRDGSRANGIDQRTSSADRSL